jgi:acyl transferase domain-containing protein/acyl carrier protein
MAVLAAEARDAQSSRYGVASDPIAVVGAACRFPGKVDGNEAFWRLLSRGGDAITEVPASRWDIDQFFDTNPDAPGKMYTRWGGFLEGHDEFDAMHFGIAPREAAAMDPQQRMLLEVSWAALEDAGIPPDRIANSDTGVYVGISTHDYAELRFIASQWEPTDAYAGIGNAASVAAGRLSYVYGWRGPSMAVDTACSSSLVALHLACQGLRLRECSMALVGGVNLILSPELTISFCRARMMAADGRCKTFDSSADGYVRGEGCGVVVLKRLADAVRGRDRVLAVIRGTAVNQDGRTNGLTAPSGPAQESVIRAALANAWLEPNDVDYLEAHGTGTQLGDAIEARALVNVFGRSREREHPLIVGSVKTNVGHLEAAAGMAGLLKVILALEHSEIPPHLHLTTQNPQLRFAEYSIEIETAHRAWRHGSRLRIAGVSSFGFSGTNAHVIVEEPPVEQASTQAEERPIHLLTLSAKTPAALKSLARSYEAHLALHPDQSIANVAFTANAGRTHHLHRIAVVAKSTSHVLEKLAAFRAGRDSAGHVSGQRVEAPLIGFLFTGQGAQYPRMGRSLYETHPVFHSAMDECESLYRESASGSLLDVVNGNGNGGQLNETRFTQPALFAFEYAMTRMWSSFGIAPAAVAGHSVGEFAAACAAGILSVHDAIHLIVHRARLMEQLPRDGSMAAVFTNEAQALDMLASLDGEVSIAAVNGPNHVVISGRTTAIDTLLVRFAKENVGSQMLNVSHAFHSPLMDPMLDEFEHIASRAKFSSPRVRFISTVTGDEAGGEVLGDANYWRLQIRQTVRFEAAINAMQQLGCRIFLELGPKPTLVSMGKRCLPEGDELWLPSVRGEGEDWSQLLKSLATMYASGAAVDWNGFDRPFPRRKVALPTYPFERTRHWMTPGSAASGSSAVGRDTGEHPMLGRRMSSPLPVVQFEGMIGRDRQPFLDDHRIFGSVVFPAAAYLEMAVAAAASTIGDETVSADNVTIQEPLFLHDTTSRALHLTFNPSGGRRGEFQIFSSEDNGAAGTGWKLHAQGVLSADERTAHPAPTLAQARGACLENVAVEDFYRDLGGRGAEYGPSFRSVVDLRRGHEAALGVISMPDEVRSSADGYRLHPVLLDACFQLIGAALSSGGGATPDGLYVPVGIERLQVRAARLVRAHAYARLRQQSHADARTVAADITLFDEEENAVAWIQGVTLARVAAGEFEHGPSFSIMQSLYELEWQLQPRLESAEKAGSGWLVFADKSGVGEDLARRIEARGGSAITVFEGDALSRTGVNTWTVDSGTASSVRRLLAEALGAEPKYLRIAYLWGLDAEEPRGGAPDGVAEVLDSTASSALYVLQALADLTWSKPPRCCVITRGAVSTAQDRAGPSMAGAPILGLGRVAAVEHPSLRCMMLDLDPAPTRGSSDAAEIEAEVVNDDGEVNVAIRDGLRYVARLIRLHQPSPSPVPPQPRDGERAFRLELPNRGMLENLKLSPAALIPPASGEVQIRVRTAGLNFRDVIAALGLYPGDAGPPGLECAGEVVAVGPGVDRLRVGDAVVAVAMGCFASHVNVPEMLAITKPAGLTYRQAATIPVAFLTAAYALNALSGLRRGERVLIHSATGGVGMAAVQLARRAGAEIFATAGSPSKRALLKAMGVDHVMDSRSYAFAEETLEATNGEGVDVILNALPGHYVAKSLSVLKDDGRFVDIGKIGTWPAEKVAAVKPRVAYHVIDLAELCRDRPAYVRSLLSELLTACNTGFLQPLPSRHFGIEDALSAFRLMEQAKHVGKIVMTMPEPITTEPPVTADATYVVTGAFGGIGGELTSWLVQQGARHLALLGRHTPSDTVGAQLESLRDGGATVICFQVDVADGDALRQVLETVRATMPEVRGLFHCAGALDDAPIGQLTRPRISTAMSGKAVGAWHLDRLTETLPLDFFVMFSSLASVLGSPGQANYAAANACLDSLAHLRHSQDRPALSINWGPWHGIGMASSEPAFRRWSSVGLRTIAPAFGLRLLEHLLSYRAPAQVAALSFDASRLSRAQAVFGQPPLLANLYQAAPGVTTPMQTVQLDDQMIERLRKASLEERVALLVEHMRRLVIKTLGLGDEYALDTNVPLNDLGLDSLAGVELKNAVEANLAVKLDMSVMLSNPSVQSLAAVLAAGLGGQQRPDTAITNVNRSAATHR